MTRVFIACALSGAAGLIYETAWWRLLRLAFGGTSEAHATVLGGFMLGLALGAVAGGRLADRKPERALALFSGCEALVAALGFASLFVLRAFPDVYASSGAGRGFRAASAGLLLVPPAACMGATLPLLVRGLGAELGQVYAINTAGAVAGALATGFVLLPWLGVSGTIAVAALSNASAAWLARGVRVELLTKTGRSSDAPDVAPFARRALLLAAALSGACALGLEVLWSRVLVLVVGSSTQAFALMLGTFLAGLAAGSALYARRPRAAGPLLLASSAGSALLLHLASHMPYAYVSLWAALPHDGATLLFLRVLPAVVLMLAPALCMGASLPALAREANDVGAIYGANTAGGVAGAVLASLFLLPRLGVAGSTAAVAGLGVAAGVLALVAARAGVTSYALAIVAAAVVLWTPAWNPVVMGRGLAYIARKADRWAQKGELEKSIESARVLKYHDGAESTVLVYDNGDNTPRAFVVNGRHEATSEPSDARNQYLLAHLPALLHEGPVKQGLVVALGSGMTAGCLALHADRVTVVELEPHVVDAARTFEKWNYAAVTNPKVNVVIDDGRHFLMTSRERYDVITVDPIHPSVVGSDALYAVEQYRLIQSRLAPHGVAAQWLPLYEMGLEDARCVVRTFAEVFADTQVWVNGSDAIIIGGAGRVPDAVRLRDGLAKPEISASLGRLRLSKLSTFVAGLALTPDGVKKYTEGAPVLTDDRPRLEFSLPWRMYDESISPNVLELYRHGAREPAIVTEGLTEDELQQIRSSRAALQADLAGLALTHVKHDRAAAELFKLALEQDPDDPIAREMLGLDY